MTELEAAISLLTDRCPTVAFMGALEEDAPEGEVFGDGSPVCIVELAGEGTPLQGSSLWQRLSLRFYAADDPAMLDAHRAARRGMFHPTWAFLPLPPVEVDDRLIDLMIVNAATGPLTEPEGRRVLIASAAAKFRY